MAGPFVAHPFLSDPLFILLTEHGSPVPDQRRSLMIATTPDLDSAVLVDGTLYIRDLVETDGDVIHVVTAADDPVDGTRQRIRMMNES